MLVLGLAAGAIYFLTRDTLAEKDAGHGVHGQKEPAEAKLPEEKDPAKEIVTLSPETMRKYGIRIGAARKRSLVAAIQAPARVAFNSEATAVIGTPVQGRVVDVKAHAGDKVERGAPLLEIESAELGEAQSDFLQRQAAVRTAQAAIGPLTEIFARIKRLHEESKLIGITEVQERELELKRAEGIVATAQAAATAATNKLHLLGMTEQAIYELQKTGRVTPRYVIRSPIAGEVTERLVNLGELVKPDRERLFVVADTSTLWVWADVPEVRAGEVAIGCPAEITLTSAGERVFKGAVCHLAPSIDDPTRSLRVRIEVPGDPALRPGMFAQAAIGGNATNESAEAVVAVPESAIQTVNGSTAVFLPVKDSPNSFQARLVSTGNYVDGMAGIISGLEPGERIVTAGSAILKAELLKVTAKDED